MEQRAQVIKLPIRRRTAEDRPKPRSIDGPRYFNSQQIRLLRKTVRDAAELDHFKDKVTAIREWMAIDILTSTGVRVSECANLRCGDLEIGYAQNKIFIRDGKNHIAAHVLIPQSLKLHLKQFLKWKQDHGEPTGKDDHLFIGQRGAWTAQAVQQLLKKYLRQLNIYEIGKSVHSLRHSYAVELYSKEKDLRAVQKQLRHVSISSTMIYADVSDEEISEQVDDLWG